MMNVKLIIRRFSKPNIPEISGIETFPGKVLHSRAYRIPDNFTNETVIVLGAGNSGIDITLDLSNYAKTVYLSHRHLMSVLTDLSNIHVTLS